MWRWIILWYSREKTLFYDFNFAIIRVVFNDFSGVLIFSFIIEGKQKSASLHKIICHLLSLHSILSCQSIWPKTTTEYCTYLWNQTLTNDLHFAFFSFQYMVFQSFQSFLAINFVHEIQFASTLFEVYLYFLGALDQEKQAISYCFWSDFEFLLKLELVEFVGIEI